MASRNGYCLFFNVAPHCVFFVEKEIENLIWFVVIVYDFSKTCSDIFPEM